MTAQWIHDKARRVGVPRDLEHHVVHLVLSHHGRLEFGSPKVPMTLEAVLTHELDELDSRVNSWLNLMGREGGNRRWTDSNNVYEQHIWRGTLPTVQAEKKGPPAEIMTPVIYVPHETRGHQPQQRPDGQKKKRPERKHEAPRPQGEPGAPAATGELAKTEGAPAAPADRPERRDRPERPPRPERGGGGFRGGPGGPGAPGGPGGDRKRGYMGPRLPGDRGPQPRPKAAPSLTHNPFAALAQKIEGGAAPSEAAPSEAPAAPAEAQPPPVEAQGAPAENAPETTSPATPAAEAPAATGDTPAGSGQ